MTSITLPLKKFPGGVQRIPAFFGGRLLVTPLTLLINLPFTLCLYHLSSNSLLNLLGLLPYLWGGITIAYYTKKSCDTVGKLFKANLSEAQLILERGKKGLRRILKLSITLSILNILLGAYPLLLYGKLSPFIVTISAIMSLEMALASTILGLSTARRIIAYTSFVGASEALFLFITLRGLGIFELIFLVVIYLSPLSCLHHLDGYDLRKFFQSMVGSN